MLLSLSEKLTHELQHIKLEGKRYSEKRRYNEQKRRYNEKKKKYNEKTI